MSDFTFVPFAKQLAEASAEIIRRYYRTPIDIVRKSDESPVTIADKQAELIMRDMIKKAYPEHGILGEEFEAHHPGAEFQWMLDPIDGTKTFISGTPLFGTLIALMHNGIPVLGVINLPILNQMLIGTDDETRLNDIKVTVRSCDKIEEATLLVTDHHDVKKFQNSKGFDGLSRRVRLYRTWADCYAYFQVATGFADIALDPIMNPWDIMALIPIIRGAGGTITDWYGGDPVKGLSTIATAGTLHDEIVQLLNAKSE